MTVDTERDRFAEMHPDTVRLIAQQEIAELSGRDLEKWDNLGTLRDEVARLGGLLAVLLDDAERSEK
jgi:hypothetical protein